MGDKLLSKILGHGIISVHVCHFDDISENSNLFSLGECLILIHGGGWWKMKIQAIGHRHLGLSAIKTLQRFDSVKDNEWTWRLDLYPIMTYKQTGPIFIWNIKQTHWVVIQPINFIPPYIHSALNVFISHRVWLQDHQGPALWPAQQHFCPGISEQKNLWNPQTNSSTYKRILRFKWRYTDWNLASCVRNI